jgi:chromosome segregation ATPase
MATPRQNRDIVLAELVKQRYELQKLTGHKSEILNRETGIYNAEIDRIRQKQVSMQTEYKTEHTECLAEYMTLIENKTKLDMEFARLETLIQQGTQAKLDRRQEYRRAIAMKNAMDSAARNSGKLTETMRADIHAKIAEIDDYLAQYPEYRRQINEDYYNWQQDSVKLKGELEQLTALTLDLTVTGRKVTPRILNQQTRLQKLVADLADDRRQDPEARYQDLDKSMDEHRAQKRIWENRIQKIELQLANPIPIQERNSAITLPPYFKEDVEAFKTHKKQYDTCKQTLESVNQQLRELHARLMDLACKCSDPDYICPELIEQRERADNRLRRVTERLDNEYDDLIKVARSRVLGLEVELASPPVVQEPVPVENPQIEPVSLPSAHVGNKNRRELKLAQMKLQQAALATPVS